MRGICLKITGILLLLTSLWALPVSAYQRTVLVENFTNWG
jgi:hypothetical protein